MMTALAPSGMSHPMSRDPRSTPAPPEVLAPAGDDAALEAAIRAGADAVYFGLQSFNARARATNFTEDGLEATIARLHAHRVKGYVALNTLVFDAELPRLESAVRAIAAAGADAVIVQDLGAARLIRAVAPDLPIHASTQMTCTDASAVMLAAELGAARVILARELSLSEIAAIRARTDIELEVFVHGALCIAYSGQCLTSEAIGGRSANRGACAQACRLPYTLVVDDQTVDTGERAFLLSPEDLEASAEVAALIGLGVSSFKIEGRLKGPEYVAATTRLYRAAIDAAIGRGPPVAPALREAALQTFSRGSGPGFLPGVDHQRLVEARGCDHRGLLAGTLIGVVEHDGRPRLEVALERRIARGDGVLVEGGLGGEGELGGRVWAIAVGGRDVDSAPAGARAALWLGPERSIGALPAGRRVFRTSDPQGARQVLAEVEARPRRRPIRIAVVGELGAPPRFEAVELEGGRRAEVTGDAPVGLARSGAPVAEVLRDKLGRLGETPFALEALEVRLPEGALLPPSSINRARRALVEALLADEGPRRLASPGVSRALVAEDAARLPAVRAASAGGAAPALLVLCRSAAQADAALDAGASGVILDFLDLVGTKDAVRALRQRGAPSVALAPPRIRKPGEEKIDRHLLGLAPDAILVRSLGALRAWRDEPVPRIGDFSLNVANQLSAIEVLSRGLACFTPSFDLDAAQLLALLTPALAPFAEVVVHHPMPLFHMEHCAIAALLSAGKDYRTCGRPCDRHQVALRDRAGMEHPVEADVGCRNTVFHAAPQSAAGLVPALLERGVRRFRVELVRESPPEVARVVETYRRLLEGRASSAEVWRALRTDGGYGVLRGSLRVL